MRCGTVENRGVCHFACYSIRVQNIVFFCFLLQCERMIEVHCVKKTKNKKNTDNSHKIQLKGFLTEPTVEVSLYKMCSLPHCRADTQTTSREDTGNIEVDQI